MSLGSHGGRWESIVAPVANLGDVEAKVSWERSYPDLLRAYYYAIASVATSESKSVGGCSGCGERLLVWNESFRSATVDSAGGSGSTGVGECARGCTSCSGCLSLDRSSSGDSRTSFADSGVGQVGCDQSFGSCGGPNSVKSDHDEILGGHRDDTVGVKEVVEQRVYGANHARNVRNREKRKKEKKEKKIRDAKSWRNDMNIGYPGFFSQCSDETQINLRESRAELLIEKNKKDLALLKSSDVAAEARRNEIRIRADIEKHMVSIEKNHSTLVATGNVPGDMTGFAATILGSGSISPNSSASMAEFRKCQKDLLDSQAQIERLIAVLKDAGIEVPHSPESDRAHNRAMGIWTDNTENRQKFDEMYSEYDLLPGHTVGASDDKVRVIPYRTEYV